MEVIKCRAREREVEVLGLSVVVKEIEALELIAVNDCKIEIDRQARLFVKDGDESHVLEEGKVQKMLAREDMEGNGMSANMIGGEEDFDSGRDLRLKKENRDYGRAVSIPRSRRSGFLCK